eukprot:scaffold30229_cov146-Isochrysis_galbana.AAC.1
MARTKKISRKPGRHNEEGNEEEIAKFEVPQPRTAASACRAAALPHCRTRHRPLRVQLSARAPEQKAAHDDLRQTKSSKKEAKKASFVGAPGCAGGVLGGEQAGPPLPGMGGGRLRSGPAGCAPPARVAQLRARSLACHAVAAGAAAYSRPLLALSPPLVTPPTLPPSAGGFGGLGGYGLGAGPSGLAADDVFGASGGLGGSDREGGAFWSTDDSDAAGARNKERHTRPALDSEEAQGNLTCLSPRV